jgi:hypothetical protein
MDVKLHGSRWLRLGRCGMQFEHVFKAVPHVFFKPVAHLFVISKVTAHHTQCIPVCRLRHTTYSKEWTVATDVTPHGLARVQCTTPCRGSVRTPDEAMWCDRASLTITLVEKHGQ